MLRVAPLQGPRMQQKDKTRVGIGAKIALVTALVTIVVFVLIFKVLSFDNLKVEPVWATYGLVITGFIFARFGLAWLYRPRRTAVTGYRPTVAIIVPAYNEVDIAKTLIACLSVDYPKDLIRGGGGGRQVHRRDVAAHLHGG